jgi:hypothetical protein
MEKKQTNEQPFKTFKTKGFLNKKIKQKIQSECLHKMLLVGGRFIQS